jgi:Mitochondrial pyruvate carriers
LRLFITNASILLSLLKAAIADLKKDEEVISGPMTAALASYSYVAQEITNFLINSAKDG